jgi:predicted KAP-like P-loop ATPase
MAPLHHDQPATDDTLQRRPFASRIANIICSQTDRSPIVISLNGEWGEGKSTVFGFLREEFHGRGIVCVSFNPWRYSGEDDLLKAFFLELATKLDDPLLNRGEKISAWASANIGWLPRLLLAATPSGVAEGVEGLLSRTAGWLTPTIERLRERLRKKLCDNQKRIVILLDDPDRLDDGELFSLFRLVKLTADFEYTTFVLAMDYDAVAMAVGHRFGSEDQGRRFLQ